MSPETGRDGRAVGMLLLLVPLVNSQTGQILPPRNMSLSWENEFCVKLAWLPPKDLDLRGCHYYLDHTTAKSEEARRQEETENVIRQQNTSYKGSLTMEGGFLKYSLQTGCKNTMSDFVFINVTYPELVKDFECSLLSSNTTSCTWRPASGAPDFQLFYRSVNQLGRMRRSAKGCSLLGASQECPAYQYNGTTKTGCNLQGNFFHHYIYFLLNGTLGNSPVRNTYMKKMLYNVRPFPLNWTVSQVNDHLRIKWTPPDVLGASWKYEVNYTECNKRQQREQVEGYYIEIPYAYYCEYRITVKAILENGRGETQSAKEQIYGIKRSPNGPFYVAIVIIPVVLAAFVVILLVCFQRHKDKLFPKVPEPRDFLRGIIQNNAANPVRKMYVPAEEEQDSVITLFIEPEHATQDG